MLTLPEIARSRYLLYHGLADVFGTHRACIAVDVLLGPEPDQVDDEDAYRRELGPDDDAQPSLEDLAWAACHPITGGAPDVEPFEPTDADWDDFHRWCELSDLADLRRRYTDDDLAAAGLAVG